MMDSLFIDNALQEIAKEYKAGLLAWLKKHSERWARLLDLEDQINQATLAGDEAGLKDALRAYRLFFEDVLKLYEAGDMLPLFGRR